MRVVSLVPSWTETLIEAGIDVCGRTRFCIHPAAHVQNIPIVGGTKNVDWEKIKSLMPDLVLLDKEENPKEFAEACSFPWLATHVLDLKSCQKEMAQLGKFFSNKSLMQWSRELGDILEKPPSSWDMSKIPGEIEKIGENKNLNQLMYLIWRSPWMAVTGDTYIGSVLKFLGAPMAEVSSPQRYPEIEEAILRKNYILFSSEPFPFLKKKDFLKAEGFVGSIVDGEKYSWFGVRSLNFLKQVLDKS
jgi:ABC-type Fe3+-hydroxamate transport system substrate-binding protein